MVQDEEKRMLDVVFSLSFESVVLRNGVKRSRKVQRNTHEGEEVELRCAATSGAVSCRVISCRIRPASRAVE